MTFEQYLADKHCELNPQVLDDELADDFDNWLDREDVYNIIKWAEDWHNKEIQQQ